MKNEMSHAAHQLQLAAENEERFTRSFVNDYCKNLTIKKAQGKYDRQLAVKLMMYFAERVAKAEDESSWSRRFPVPVRKEFAEYCVGEFEDRYKDGEFEKFIPKKYLMKPAKKVAAKRK